MSQAGSSPIKAKDRDTIIQALNTGVVPRLGLKYIQVGRLREIQSVIRDLDRVAEGGSAVRFIIGEYGAGKTFFMNLVRLIALEKRLVTVSADLAPDRRLQASGGQARSLYAESLRNLSTRTKPDGGGLAGIVERFVSDANDEALKAKAAIETIIQNKLATIKDLLGGYDFAQVLTAYWRAAEAGEQDKKDAALRWIRGEYATKTEARAALGVRTIIDDSSIYDHWKLLAAFVRLAGYGGLLVCLDEMVNLYKLQNKQSREANYEQILRMVNDSLQGTASGMGFMFGGTPDFLLDTRRGLYSYQALQSRLAENTYATGGLVDFNGPVLRLQSLTPEDLRVLLEKLRFVYAGGDPAKFLVPDEALDAFMEHCRKRIGDAYFRTPRTVTKSFLSLLAVLEQNPGTDWRAPLGAIIPEVDTPPADTPITDGDDELTSLNL